MNAIVRQTPQQIFDRTRNQFSAEVLGGGEVIPESNEWYVVSNDAAAAMSFYAIADQMWRERDPRYACEENLIDMAARDGVYPLPAQEAVGYIELVATAGVDLPDQLQFQVGDQSYTSQSTLPSEMPADGTIIVRVAADTPGTAGNSPGATTGTLTTVVNGLTVTSVTVFGNGFCDGAEAETIDAFRTRYLNRLAYKPRATFAFIQEKLLEWPCVTRTAHRCGACNQDIECCDDCYNLLEFYVFMDDTFDCGLPPQCVVDEIKDWLFGETQGYGEGQVEFGVCGGVYTATGVAVDIAIQGMACLSESERTEVVNTITDFFKTLEPSQTLCLRQITSAVDRIATDPCSYDIVLTPATTDSDILFVTECGDIDFYCDYMPCIGEITFTDETLTTGGVCA